MEINIYYSKYRGLYGDAIEQDYCDAYKIYRFCICDNGDIIVCEGNAYDKLHTSIDVRTIAHTLARFFGAYEQDVRFNADSLDYIDSIQ